MTGISEPDIDEAEKTEGSEDIHARAIADFESVVAACAEERALNLEDRRFVSIAGAQWEGLWGDQFANSIMVEVNKTAQGVEKIIADYRANRMIVDFRGVGKGTDEKTADTLDGMFRADFYVSKGQQATDNAFEEAVQGGIGAWRLTNVYADEFDPDTDHQRIAFESIVDADQSVFWDPNARLYDKSDARWCIVITSMAKAEFEREYGLDHDSDWPQGLFKTNYDWFTPDVVRVAEYYTVEVKAEKLHVLQNRTTQEERREWASDLTDGDLEQLAIEGWRELRVRMVKRRRVRKYVLSGAAIIGPEKGQIIAGDCIPIIPVYGKRWWIDNMERTRGHVRLAKDPQRIYNAQISKLTETAATAATERPIFTPEQVAGHEAKWAEANINRAPYALINPTVNADGSTQPVGPIGMISPPQLSPVLGALIQITGSDIAEITSADNGADQTKANVSAQAMDLAATRVDAKSGIYMDNMKQSWQRCGEVWLSMARDIYVEEGREVETMGRDGEQGTTVLKQGFTDPQGRYSIRNDLAKGKYRVISDVTEATTTRRDKTVKTLINGSQVVAGFDPELASAMMMTAMLNMDGEGVEDLQSWMRTKALSIGLVQPTKDEQDKIDQAQQQDQAPDPQAEALMAAAAQAKALAGKAVADTKLSEAKTIQTLADAEKTRQETDHGAVERKVGMIGKVRDFFSPRPMNNLAPINPIQGPQP